jgi:RNA polymerase sigma-70 factor (ECF subfamily)
MAVVGIEVAGTGEEALRQLLLSGLNAAYRTATCILRDPVAAEDAVQEAAARAWAHRRELRDPARVDAWFGRIVTNVCRAELARRSRGPVAGRLEPPGAMEDLRGPDAELVDEVGRALARLTPQEQLVVAMRYGRDMTVPQIAAVTGLREGTVKSRLHNAHEHLRAAFSAEARAEEMWR